MVEILFSRLLLDDITGVVEATGVLVATVDVAVVVAIYMTTVPPPPE